MKERAKTVALVVLGLLYVLLALHPPQGPRPVEHEVELAPAYLAVKDDLASARRALGAARAEIATCDAAAAQAAAEGDRQARWSAAVDAHARGAVRTASRLYEEYAGRYPGSKRAQLAAWRAQKLRAELAAKDAAPGGARPAAPARTPRPLGAGAFP